MKGFATGSALLILATAPAHAQQIEKIGNALDIPEEESGRPINVGALTLQPRLEVETEFDDNVYASQSSEMDDFKFTAKPSLNIGYDNGNVVANLYAEGAFRRFAELTTENSDAGVVRGDIGIRLGETDRLNFGAGWDRLVEDRGDPEARQQAVIGPRLADRLSARASYSHSGTRVEFSIDGLAEKYDFTSAFDRERDHDNLSATARLGYRISGSTTLIGVTFVNRRNFDLATDNSGTNRDATTYGARAGIRLAPGAPIRGQATIGVFRFEPDAANITARTGVSAAASLILQPNQRLAFTIDAFRGDVATFRTGATSRSDTRIQLGVQQEVRHNLQWQAGIVYGKRHYYGIAGNEKLWAGLFEVEYKLRRNLVLAAGARYSDRNSNIASEDYDRLRATVALRLRF